MRVWPSRPGPAWRMIFFIHSRMRRAGERPRGDPPGQARRQADDRNDPEGRGPEATMTRRTRGREIALQVLYQAEQNPGLAPDEVRRFVERRLRGDRKLCEFAEALIAGRPGPPAADRRPDLRGGRELADRPHGRHRPQYPPARRLRDALLPRRARPRSRSTSRSSWPSGTARPSRAGSSTASSTASWRRARSRGHARPEPARSAPGPPPSRRRPPAAVPALDLNCRPVRP